MSSTDGKAGTRGCGQDPATKGDNIQRVPRWCRALHVHLPEGKSGASLKSRAGGKLPLRKAQGKETTAAGAHLDKKERRHGERETDCVGRV